MKNRTAKKVSSSNSTVKINVDRDLANNIRERIFALLDRKNGSWNGTATDLGRAITTGLRRSATENWPKTPSVMRKVLNTMVYSLRRAGVKVEFARVGHDRTRTINIERV
jgi:hypothetical protein